MFKIITFFFALILAFRADSYSQQIKLITYNVRYENTYDGKDSWIYRKDELVKQLKFYEPDIFGVQEAVSNQVNYIDSCLKNYTYIGVGRDDGRHKGEYSPIFYKKKNFTLITDSTFWLSETQDTGRVGWDAVLPRICTFGLFENTKTHLRMWVFNTHFDHKGEKARESSAKLILKTIRQVNKENHPVIVMGDFNSAPEEMQVLIMKETLKDAMEIAVNKYEGPQGTFNGFGAEKIRPRIDYFFVEDVEVLEYLMPTERRRENRFISDHFPIMIIVAP